MCGIAGKYNIDNSPVNPELIKAMCSKIVYRGPDDSGVYVAGNIGLGHRRLSIIDLSPLGHQPMSSADGKIWITFNGEIYNFQSLRDELISKGYKFKSNSDTEVIICLYMEYGEACLQYLRGMFAFAIWDGSRNRLFLARDRIGKKPLFYYHDDKTIVFASEIKSILEDAVVQKRINYEAFCDYFKYLYIPDPKTIYQNISKLEPGYYLICSAEGITRKEYWDVSFAGQNLKGEDEISQELLGILEESVRLRMISDVPLGAFLSGGVDSSGVVALMAKQQNTSVTTCSIGFDSMAYDEVKFARIIANRFSTDHYEFTVKENAEDILTRLAYHFDEPFADPSAVPTYYVSKLARQRVTVALSGDGGDENFVGYQKYHTDDIENRIRRRVPGFIRSHICPVLSEMLYRFDGSIFQKGGTLMNTLSHEPDYGFYLSNTVFNGPLWDELINGETRREIGGYDPFSVTSHYYRKADTDDHLSKILYTDLKTYLQGILVKVDRMSMAHSLEVRSPILDHKVVEFAASIPSRLKYKDREMKYILKKTFRMLLPDEVMNRKKMGFSVPLEEWLRGELRDFAYNRLFSGKAAVNNFFNRMTLLKIWDMHQSRKRNYATILWSLLMFELWYGEFME